MTISIAFGVAAFAPRVHGQVSPPTPPTPLSRADLPKALVVPSDPAGQLRLLTLLARQPPSDNDLLVPWIQQNVDELPPMFLALLARRTFDQSPADALEWFALSYARALYDAQRCSDPTAGADLGLPLMAVAGQPLVNYRLSHSDENAAAEQRALARKDLFSDKVSPSWICIHGLAAMQQQLQGQAAPPMLKPADQWPALQQRVRASMEAEIKKTFEGRAARKALPADTIELRVPHKGVPFGLAWSPDGKQLAMTLSGDSHVVIWDAAAGAIIKEFDRGTSIPDAIAFTGGGDLVTSSAADAPNLAVVSEFDPDSNAVTRRYGQVAGNAAFAVDEAMHLIAYLSRGSRLPGVTLANLADSSAAMPAIMVENDVPSALAFGRGATLAIGTLGGKILLFDTSNGQLRQTIDAFDHDWVESLAFSLDGQHLAAGSAGGSSSLRGPDGQMHSFKHQTTLRVWNIADNTPLVSCSELVGNEGTTVRSVAWDADNRHLAYLGYNRVLLIDINAPHPRLVMQFSQNTGQFSSASLAFSPDGRRLAMTGDNIARIVPLAPDKAAASTPDGASCQ